MSIKNQSDRSMKTLIKTKGNRRSPFGGWTKERRAAAAERCRAHKPSRFATGPRTRGGKAVVRLNGLKHGATSAHWRELYRAMSRYRRFVNEIMALQGVCLLADISCTGMNWRGGAFSPEIDKVVRPSYNVKYNN